MYYKKLDWVVLPKNMHDELLILAHSSENIRPANRRGRNNYHHYLLPSSIEQWCRNNLPIDHRYVCRLQRFFDTDHIPKHIDESRTATFNYLLTSAGPITSWFIEDQLMESVIIPQHQWYYINVSITHAVVQINQERIALCIFMPTHPEYPTSQSMDI
jgi:hypothetical protein